MGTSCSESAWDRLDLRIEGVSAPIAIECFRLLIPPTWAGRMRREMSLGGGSRDQSGGVAGAHGGAVPGECLF
eukprot:383121-Prorocentrum_minimum.AAC.1